MGWLGENGLAILDDPLEADGEQLGVPVLFVSDEAPDTDVILGTALGR